MAKKTKRRASISDQLRDAIATCGLSRYRIAKETGLQASALSRFASGERELSPQAVNAIGELLDLELVMHGPKSTRDK